ncbi:MAG: SUMF1/EgtB/PvdO family nonheme iron enzyme [Chitinispirillaceae bacterium]|nr:SUMF1/EgtB/PvdO family nonheme iron enzyme [Chitinispirillaceae bacterium]
MSLKQVIRAGSMAVAAAVTMWMVAGCANSVNNSNEGIGVEITDYRSGPITTEGGTASSWQSENFTETVNGVALDMVFVQGGTYQRGCDNCAPQDRQYESPVHAVTLSSYHIGKYEVTQAQ